MQYIAGDLIFWVFHNEGAKIIDSFLYFPISYCFFFNFFKNVRNFDM